jgi:hypothetical protein
MQPLNWVLKEQVDMVCTVHQDRKGPVVASCDEGFIDQLSDDQFLKKYFVPWSKLIR